MDNIKVGDIFGDLKIIEILPPYINKDKKIKIEKYKCLCSCGNVLVIQRDNLFKRKNKNCGHCGLVYSGSGRKYYNKYDLSGEFGIGYTSKKEEFYFDLEDYDKIKDYCWTYNNNGYLYAHDINNHKKQLFLHRLVMNVVDEDFRSVKIDHIDCPGKSCLKKDNRKTNLRIVTTSQNSMNMNLKSNNTSGYTGVYELRGKWYACITVNGKTIRSKTFDCKDDAVLERKNLEKIYFNNFNYNGGK
jgi:hypothetical protein